MQYAGRTSRQMAFKCIVKKKKKTDHLKKLWSASAKMHNDILI